MELSEPIYFQDETILFYVRTSDRSNGK